MKIQLPNDAQAAGYVQTRPYHFEQVFKSVSANFTGTEREFVRAGHAYAYTEAGAYTRNVVQA